MAPWKNEISNWLSFIDMLNPLLEDEEDLTKEIEDSDTLPWSKKFLIKRLEKYSNNDEDNSEDDLNSEEIKKIRELINEYDIVENNIKNLEKN